ncbi:SDR family oxidoreductase [Spirillospora sp. CA-255316]
MPENPPASSPGCALITGTSRGIGRAIAIRLATDGYDIAGCSRTPGTDADETAAAVKAQGVRSLFVQCDVRDDTAVGDFVERAQTEIGPITAVVNNAAITSNGAAPFLSREAWRDVLDVNLSGVWNVCQASLFHLMREGAGSIVNIASIVGIDGFVTMGNYAASKAGVIGLSRSLAREAGPHGVRVNVVAPGVSETEMMDEIPAAARAGLLDRVPLGRFGQAADIAELVAFLVSERASYITGQVIRVDGGATL